MFEKQGQRLRMAEHLGTLLHPGAWVHKRYRQKTAGWWEKLLWAMAYVMSSPDCNINR